VLCYDQHGAHGIRQQLESYKISGGRICYLEA